MAKLFACAAGHLVGIQRLPPRDIQIVSRGSPDHLPLGLCVTIAGIGEPATGHDPVLANQRALRVWRLRGGSRRRRRRRRRRSRR
jgi:hypothetical protein